MYEDLRAKVERGAKLLDEKLPEWRSKIDLDLLDISTATQCVLGQLFGDYRVGLSQLFWTGERMPYPTPMPVFNRAVECGFTSNFGNDDEDEEEWGFDCLTSNWIDILGVERTVTRID